MSDDTEFRGFQEAIDNIAGQVVQLGGQDMMQILSEIVRDMQASAPRKTGALASSIKYLLKENNEYAIQMRDYGFYQNWGVAGVRQDRAIDTPEFGLGPDTLAPRAGFGGKYAFRDRRNPQKHYYGEDRRYGIRARQFFSLEDIERTIVDRLQQQANNIQP